MTRVLSQDEKQEIYDHIRQFLSDELDVPLRRSGRKPRLSTTFAAIP